MAKIIYLLFLLLVSSSGSDVPRENEVTEFNSKVSRSLKRVANITGQEIAWVFAESIKDFEKKEVEREEEQMFHTFHRELISNLNTKTSKHDLVYPPTNTFPTTPITNPVTTPITNPITTPVTGPPDNAAPGIVTVPGMNPITATPIPPSTPVPQPNTDPDNSPLPITNPVTMPNTTPGAQLITNPVTTYPAQSSGVPVATPVTTTVTPATSNAPAVPGQSWCVAKSGASQIALQSALDYACGTGVADCSVIQQSGSCYNSNTLQSHASYDFNSYYQKKPDQTSCDFGGAAILTNINPSTGSCIYSSSSLSSSSSSPTPVSPTTVSPTPMSPMPETPTPTTAANSRATIPGSGSSPAVPNGSRPEPDSPISSGEIPSSAFGENPLSNVNSTTSISIQLQPFIGCIILVTSVVTRIFVLDM